MRDARRGMHCIARILGGGNGGRMSERRPQYGDMIEVLIDGHWHLATHRSDAMGGREFFAQIFGGGPVTVRYAREGKDWRWPRNRSKSA